MILPYTPRERRYTVYRHISPAGKIYVGATCSRDLRDRWHYGHGYKTNKPFWEDIKRYGWANFIHEILARDLSAEEAKQQEEYYITLYECYKPEKGYNHRRYSVLPYANMSPEKIAEINQKQIKYWYERNTKLYAERSAKDGN